MGDVENIICAIFPDKYYGGTPCEIKKYKGLIKKQGIDVGIKNAKPQCSSEHKLVYESNTETLEPIYFWILDFMNNLFKKVTKISDNFTASPGSGHFAEIGGRKTQMQQQAATIMATINTILRSVINLIYDLKEFKMRLKHYENADSKDKDTQIPGMLALKQIWMDKVDMLRGQGSINALSSGNLQFVTLRDAFLKVNSQKEIDDLDLNDRVIRILKPRFEEFLEWRIRSEKELSKRFEIEKAYLKSQVNALKLQARWAKPYLKAAQKLETSEELEKSPGLVNIFNTILLELALMGKNAIDVEGASSSGDLPKEFGKMKNLKKYNSIVIIDFNFRGIPNKVGQHYTFGGRAEVTFKSYALTDDELLLLNEKLSDSDLEDSFKLIQGMTDDSLGQLKIDLDELLEEKEKQEEKEFENINPFTALFGFLKPKEKKLKEKSEARQLKEKGIKSENYAERYIRNLAEANAINLCFTMYDVYKKVNGMASFPFDEKVETSVPQSEAEKLFGFK